MHQIRYGLLMVGFLLIGVVLMNLTTGTITAREKPGQVLKHVVMYKFKDGLPATQLQEVIETFAGLPKKVDTIIGFEQGTNVSQEGKSEGFTHIFVVTFRDEAGLGTYLKHPAHDAYVKVVRDRREKVIVFDYWAEAPAPK